MEGMSEATVTVKIQITVQSEDKTLAHIRYFIH